jgi:hypothetical protein
LGRFGVEPVCSDIGATRTLPTTATGEVLATRPSRGNPGRSFQRRFAARSMTPSLPNFETGRPVLASSATSM